MEARREVIASLEGRESGSMRAPVPWTNITVVRPLGRKVLRPVALGAANGGSMAHRVAFPGPERCFQCFG